MVTTIFTHLPTRLRRALHSLRLRLTRYFRRLLFPLYLFPLKLVTYSLYYALGALGRLVLELLKILRDMLLYPFLSLRNLLKSVFIIFLVLYIPASLLATLDYLHSQYGPVPKFWCSLGATNTLSSKVVRIVGNSEGSGFFITPNQVLTNFHVIDGELSPKVIFPDGSFISAQSIVGDRGYDLAVLTLPDSYPDLVIPLPSSQPLLQDSEPVLSSGYPLGTDLVGEATILRGSFLAFRSSSQAVATYLQSDISLIEGMSGGPLTDMCGNLIGINTQGVAGLSLFIDAFHATKFIPGFTDQDVQKLEFDPSISPEQAVNTYYTYIMTRQLDKGFELLSKSYLNWTTYDEWTTRFTDILNIDVVLTVPVPRSPDTVFIKFITKSWTGSEAVLKYYEGTWETVLEDGVYKMNRSKILEVPTPDWSWSYSLPEF